MVWPCYVVGCRSQIQFFFLLFYFVLKSVASGANIEFIEWFNPFYIQFIEIEKIILKMHATKKCNAFHRINLIATLKSFRIQFVVFNIWTLNTFSQPLATFMHNTFQFGRMCVMHILLLTEHQTYKTDWKFRLKTLSHTNTQMLECTKTRA